MLRTVFWFLYRATRAAVECAPIIPENGTGIILRFVIASGLAKKKVFALKIAGRDVLLRSATPDAKTAVANLTNEFAIVAEHIPSDARLIVDAGGYIGTSALYFAKAFPKATVVVLEPSAENLEILRQNVAGVERIVVIEKALSATAAVVPLIDTGTGEWGYSIAADAARSGHNLLGQSVETTTLREVLAVTHAQRIDLLKLDIEGSERELLAEGPSALAAVDALVCELHERISHGATRATMVATEGWRDFAAGGEKIFCLRPPVATCIGPVEA